MLVGTRPLTVLLSLALLASNVVAEDDVTLANHGKSALGLSVLSPKQAGISLWRVRAKTMWGFEMDLAEVSTVRQIGNLTKDYLNIRFRPAFTIKRFGSLKRKTVPFSFQTIYASIFHSSYDAFASFGSQSAGIIVGIGVLWLPLKDVSLSFRQGIALAYDNRIDTKDNRHRSFSFRVPSTRLLALLHF